MTIAVAAQRNALAAAYGSAAPNLCLFTADPGSSGTAANEVTGGSPAYARKSAGWNAPSNGTITGTQAAFDIPSGTTVNFVGVSVGSVAGVADVRDKTGITAQQFSSQGQLLVTATYTQT